MGREGDTNDLGREAVLLFAAHMTIAMFSTATGSVMLSMRWYCNIQYVVAVECSVCGGCVVFRSWW